MKTLLLIAVLTFVRAMAAGQTFAISYEIMGSSSTVSIPAMDANLQVKNAYGVYLEAGTKSNWAEYFTLAYLSLGFETDGKVWVSGNVGGGYLTNIPQMDIHIKNGDTIVLSKGYTTKGILTGLMQLRIGYKINKDLSLYGIYSFTDKVQWMGGGVRLTINK